MIRGESHDDRKPREASKRGEGGQAERETIDEQNARRHEERNARLERRRDATPHGTRGGEGSEPDKQAETSRTGYGMNAQGAGEAMRMPPHNVIVNCKD